MDPFSPKDTDIFYFTFSGVPNDHHLYGWSSSNTAANRKLSSRYFFLLNALFSQVILKELLKQKKRQSSSLPTCPISS